MRLNEQSSSPTPYNSNAETQLAEALQKAGIHGFHDAPIVIVLIPDWRTAPIKKAIFLDGPPHDNTKDYDNAVRIVLERNRWNVLRVSHTGTLTKKQLEECVDFART